MPKKPLLPREFARRTSAERPNLLAGPQQSTRCGPRIRALLIDRLTRHQRLDIAIDALHEPASASREVVADLRGVQPQALEIDHIDIGALARLQPATIGETEEIRGFARVMCLSRDMRKTGGLLRRWAFCASARLPD